MKNKIQILWIIGLLTIIILSGCTTGHTIKDQEDIKIGIILPLSGKAATYGESSQQGIEITKKEITKNFPDLNFKIYYEDSAYIPQKGVSSYKYLKNTQEINAVISAASQVSIAIQPLAKEDNILQMAIFSSAQKYSTPNDLSFRISTRSEVETKTMAKLIKEKNYKKLAIIYIDNDFGINIKDSLKKQLNSTEITNEEAFLLETNDFRTTLTKIKNNEPEAIFIVGPAKSYIPILKQAHELNLNVQFLSMRSAEDQTFVENTKELSKGLIYTYPFDATSQNIEVQNFVHNFYLTYNKIPDAYAAEGYEGFKLVASSFIQCKKDYECIQNYFTNLNNYQSIYGNLSFDINGDVHYTYFLKTIQNGKFIPLEN